MASKDSATSSVGADPTPSQDGNHNGCPSECFLSLAVTLALHIGLHRCSRACHIKRRWLCKRIRPGCYRRIRTTSISDSPRINKPQSVTPEHVKKSCAGPKSSGPCTKRRMLLYLVLVSHLVPSATAVAAGAGARVAVSTGITAGAVHHDHKQCHRGGKNIGKAIERKHGSGISWTAKRALRRARARAVEHGGTHYRGRWYSSEHLGCTTRGLNTLPTTTKKCDGSKHKAEPRKGDKRIQALTWNMSGASSAAWQELMAWLEQHQHSIDVALIQETHWRNEGSRDFESGPWNVLTTGCSAKDSKAGLAILVHKRMGRAEMLSARTLLQGRIQHVRIHQGINSTDVINVYQHVWRSQDDRESNLRCRASVWTQLRQVTAHIPQRNTLLIGGDFNCTVRRLPRHVGSALSPVREAANDQEDFLSYLQDYGLSILNTWNARPAHTCQTGDARTQIDFLITRVQHADAVAKQSAPWQAAPVGRWKANHHVTDPWNKQLKGWTQFLMNVSGLSTLLKPGLMTVFLPNLPINLSSKTCGECMPITNVLGWPPWAIFCASGDCLPPSTKLPSSFENTQSWQKGIK